MVEVDRGIARYIDNGQLNGYMQNQMDRKNWFYRLASLKSCISYAIQGCGSDFICYPGLGI